MLNLDRNNCNILVQQSTPAYSQFEVDSANDSANSSESYENKNLKLVPIDHGLSIPDTLEVSSYNLAWTSSNQADQPFSQKSLDYIKSLDIIVDIALLERCLKFRPKCLRNMRISSTLLQLGATEGLTLN
jgi:hypothetical protein